jgi:hypothetical protein
VRSYFPVILSKSKNQLLLWLFRMGEKNGNENFVENGIRDRGLIDRYSRRCRLVSRISGGRRGDVGGKVY